jgi:rod shape-determining protein MreD
MEKEPGIRPRQTIWHRLDIAARYGVPGALTIGVLLLLSLPLGAPGQAQMQPVWALASVFFWTLYRPASLPASLVFSVGLLLDLLAQGPIGLHPLLLLLTHAAVLRWRRFLTRQGFGSVWLVFILVAMVAATAEFLAVALLSWRALPAWPALFECLMAVGGYPVLSVLLTKAHQGIAAPEKA